MKDSARMEILKLKGNTISHKFIENYEKEWLEVIERLKRSGADLSRIEIAEKQGRE